MFFFPIRVCIQRPVVMLGLRPFFERKKGIYERLHFVLCFKIYINNSPIICQETPVSYFETGSLLLATAVRSSLV